MRIVKTENNNIQCLLDVFIYSMKYRLGVDLCFYASVSSNRFIILITPIQPSLPLPLNLRLFNGPRLIIRAFK